MGDKTRTRFVSWRGKLFRDTQGGVIYPLAQVADLRGYGYTRVGSNNPKYRALIRQHLNATGPMTVNVSEGKTEDFSYVLLKRGSTSPSDPEYSRIYSSGMDGVHLNVNLPTPIIAHFSTQASMDNACAIAKRIVHKRLTARRRQFQGGVAALELRKTLQMVIRPAKKVRTLLDAATRRIPKAMKSLKRSGASRHSKAKQLADLYLELTFGWQPLLADTRDGALALARLATRDALERQQFRAFGADDKTHLLTTSTHFGVGYDPATTVFIDREWRDISSAECIIYGRFAYRLQDSSYAKSSALRLAELCGFTLADFLPTAWEAMPWSFVVDYFSNVGDVIEAFSNNVSEIQWASEVHIQESKEDFLSVINQKDTSLFHGTSLVGLSDARTHCESSRKTVVRIPSGVDLSTYLRLSLPSGLQWLNIGALAVGARPPKPFY